MPLWVDALRVRHADLVEEVDWPSHVRGLNERLGLTGRYRLTESRWAPEFFLAALGRLQPRRWLAVVSLNPKEMSAENRSWHEAQLWTPASYWDYLLREDLRGWQVSDFYYRKWAYPLVIMMAELAGDESLLDAPEVSYMYGIGAFELIPFPSHEYASGTFAAMEDDPACRFSRDVALAAIANCPPLAVVANGTDSAAAVPEWLALDVSPVEHRYESSAKPGKVLRHWQSSIETPYGSVPYAGFPFLRTQSGHNSFEEIRQLAREIGAAS
ncbi:MAG: hypothetical protein AB7F65_04450 [Dehalococcoidia bacterium]